MTASTWIWRKTLSKKLFSSHIHSCGRMWMHCSGLTAQLLGHPENRSRGLSSMPKVRAISLRRRSRSNLITNQVPKGIMESWWRTLQRERFKQCQCLWWRLTRHTHTFNFRTVSMNFGKILLLNRLDLIIMFLLHFCSLINLRLKRCSHAHTQLLLLHCYNTEDFSG